MARLKHVMARAVVGPVAVLEDVARAARSRVRLAVFHQREFSIRLMGERHTEAPPRRRVLAFVTHVIPRASALPKSERQGRVVRLKETLDGLLCSLALEDLHIIINTYRDWELLEELPEYQRQRITVIRHQDGDPMFIEFHAHDYFYQHRQSYDRFLFLEDDIVIRDACFLDKIDEFTARAPYPDAILVPHRYEFINGEKYYIDPDFEHKTWKGAQGHDAKWVVQSATEVRYPTSLGVGGVRFCEFTNPHAAFFCLNREQVEAWRRTGQHWKWKVSWIGPLESAATGALFERFRVYKPAPEHRFFLEVQHWDTKYGSLIREKSGPPGPRQPMPRRRRSS